MKTLNTKPVSSAFGGIASAVAAAMDDVGSPRRGRGIYDMVPTPYDPTVTGGGSLGYNQSLHDNKW
jgi:hypothetical protein